MQYEMGQHVTITPMEDAPGRVVAIECTVEGGWITTVRYLHNGEAKVMRCFHDELKPMQTREDFRLGVPVPHSHLRLVA